MSDICFFSYYTGQAKRAREERENPVVFLFIWISRSHPKRFLPVGIATAQNQNGTSSSVRLSVCPAPGKHVCSCSRGMKWVQSKAYERNGFVSQCVGSLHVGSCAMWADIRREKTMSLIKRLSFKRVCYFYTVSGKRLLPFVCFLCYIPCFLVSFYLSLFCV